ncbi:MAG: tetratricopeptide repeat protein, partial [Anaerolineae bacterium]|nr:tetratricopeptide repeat protein [Anaerolineae bacterium]
RYIDTALLSHLQSSSSENSLENWLQACAEAAVLEATGESWRFSHDKLREAVRDNLSPEETIRLNRRVAEAIETLYEDDLSPHAAVLARRWAAAQDTRKEGHYALIAADQAYEKNAYRESLRLLQQALEIQVHTHSENPQKALAQLYNKMGMASLRLSEFEAARQQQNTALRIYQQLNDPLGIRDAISEIGDIDLRPGNYDAARQLFEQSLKISRQLNERKKIAYDLMNLGNLAQMQEHFQLSLKIREECLEIMRDVGTPVDIARALNNLALSHDLIGNKEHALEIHEEALTIRRQLNEPQGIAYSLINMAVIAQEQQDYDRARERVTEGLKLLKRIGERAAVASVYGILGDIALATGDLITAQQHLLDSLKIRRELGDKHGMTFALTKLGEIALKLGDFPNARSYFRESLSIRQQLDVLPQKLLGLDSFAQLFAAMGNWSEVVDILTFLQSQPDLPTLIQNLEPRLITARGHLPMQESQRSSQTLDDLIARLLSQG